MGLTEEKIKIYALLFDVIWKALYAFIFLLAFIAVLGFLIYFCFNSGSADIKIILGSIEAILSGTLFVVTKHYFPTGEKTDKTKKSPKKKK